MNDLMSNDKSARVCKFNIKPGDKNKGNIVLPLWRQPEPPLAKVSTGSIAGSSERIAVYRSRAERGEALFHPKDCKLIAVRSSHSHVG